MQLFDHATLVASNDTSNGGVATVECRSQPISVSVAESISLQLTIHAIWGAGTAAPKLSLTQEFSSDGVEFAEIGGTASIDNKTAADTYMVFGTACAGFVRLVATFELDASGTTGPGAVTFDAWITHGDGA